MVRVVCSFRHPPEAPKIENYRTLNPKPEALYASSFSQPGAPAAQADGDGYNYKAGTEHGLDLRT